MVEHYLSLLTKAIFVENINEIFSVPNIDGFIIGPYDLSSSMGKPGKFDDKDVKEAIGKDVWKILSELKV